jgi:predicted NACHT family NTPase
MERYNQLHEEVNQDRLSSEGQSFEIQFKNKMKQEAGVAWSRKRKTIQSVNVAAVHELDDMSSDDESCQRSRQTGSTYGSSISSQPAIQLVCITNVMCDIGIALEYTA